VVVAEDCSRGAVGPICDYSNRARGDRQVEEEKKPEMTTVAVITDSRFDGCHSGG